MNCKAYCIAVNFSESCHLFPNVVGCPWKDTGALSQFVGLKIEELIVGGALHGVGLARARLSVGKDAGILTIECGLYERLDLLEYILLARVRQEHLVEVVHNRLGRSGHEELEALVLDVALSLLAVGADDELRELYDSLACVHFFNLRLYSAEDPHVSFQVKDLVLLNLTDLLVLKHAVLQVPLS